MSEHNEQCALFDWAYDMQGQYPALELLHAIPNGGHRVTAVAVKMKREGVKAGVLDVCLPVSSRGYHVMYIEMKYGKNKLTDSQAYWKSRLEAEGAYCPVCYSADEAIKELKWYLGIK